MIQFYRIIINFLFLISPLIFLIRIIKKKEHPKRFKEKFGIFSEKRRKGKLIWFHGSSVGELLSVIPLIEVLESRKDISQILITSNTFSSSKVISTLNLKKTTHQFFPIDTNFLALKFLSYWKPHAVFFIESEIWPNHIKAIKENNIPLVLINARITETTYLNWKKIDKFSKNIFNNFDLCLSQNKETAKFLKNLGSSKVFNVGNLKYSKYQTKDGNKIRGKTNNFFKRKKNLFGSFSTHPGEERFIAEIHLELKKKFTDLLTIIVPRHVDRSDNILEELNELKLKVYVHSSNELIDNNTDIYLVDTFGETEEFMKKCPIVFLGGSIIKHGGQNPLEAARSGCKIIHGTNVYNFTEVYSLLKINKISKVIKNKSQSLKIIKQNLGKKGISRRNIIKLDLIGKKILDDNIKVIKKYIV